MEQLKNLRRQLGLSQHELASLTGCKRTQLAMAESGKRPAKAGVQTLLSLFSEVELGTPAKDAREVKPSIDTTGLAKTIRVSRSKLTGYQLRMETWERKLLTTEKLLTTTALLTNQKELPELHLLQVTILQRQATAKLGRYRKSWVKCRLQIASLQAIINEALLLCDL